MRTSLLQEFAQPVFLMLCEWDLGEGRSRVIPIRKVLAGASWQIVLFSLDMYLVVHVLRNAGLTDELAKGLVWLGRQGPWLATVGTGFAATILSSVMNNNPLVSFNNGAVPQPLDG